MVNIVTRKRQCKHKLPNHEMSIDNTPFPAPFILLLYVEKRKITFDCVENRCLEYCHCVTALRVNEMNLYMQAYTYITRSRIPPRFQGLQLRLPLSRLFFKVAQIRSANRHFGRLYIGIIALRVYYKALLLYTTTRLKCYTVSTMLQFGRQAGNEISAAHNVEWVNPLLDCSQHLHSSVREALTHPLLADFAHWGTKGREIEREA